MNPSPRRILLEGSIAAGKTTLIKMLALSFPNAVFLPEPVDQWRDCNGVNALELFYADKKRYSHAFQHIALMSRVEQYLNLPHNAGLIFSERSPESCRYCFAEMLYESGDYDPSEYAIYRKDYDIVRRIIPQPSIIIYLNTSVDECLMRLKKRARGEETGVSREYLLKLQAKYMEWLHAFEKDGGHVEIIDGNCDFQDDLVVQAATVKKIVDIVDGIDFMDL